tara:strand:- start:390 stop:839 length:450 start_codon:yes stop_codon:yes gene_type:complete
MSILKLLSLIFIFGLYSSCSSIIQSHGHVPLNSDLEKIKVGIDNKKSIESLIGKPTTASLLNNRDWYYIGSTMKHSGWKKPQEIKRVIIAISFTQAGVVENIERYSLSDGQEIKISSRVTRKKVKDNTFLRQLLGNFGRVDIPTAFGNN